MTISAEATPKALSRPNGVFPVIDLTTGCLTEHGLQMLSQWHGYINGANRITPCNATGKNVITLTPLAASPLIEKYTDFEVFAFVAEQTSDAAVTATVVPRDGTLSTIKVFKTNGSAQAGSGDVVAGSLYLAIYNDALDTAAGGFVLK
jgi:hypothetical protein